MCANQACGIRWIRPPTHTELAISTPNGVTAAVINNRTANCLLATEWTAGLAIVDILPSDSDPVVTLIHTRRSARPVIIGILVPTYNVQPCDLYSRLAAVIQQLECQPTRT